MRRKYVLALLGVLAIIAFLFAVVWSEAGFWTAFKSMSIIVVPLSLGCWVGWVLGGD